MTLPALSVPYRQPSLEEAREDLRAEEQSLTEQRKAFSLKLHRLYLRWQLLFPGAKKRAFIEWYAGKYQGRLYRYLAAGLANEAGLDRDDLQFGELADYGEYLLAGLTAADVRAGRVPEKTETTSITVSRDVADALDSSFDDLSEGDKPATREDRLATAVTAFTSAPPVLRAAMLHSSATGENPIDALIRAVDDRRNWRGWLSRQPCLVSRVAGGVHLHHLKIGQDNRFRSNEVLIPLQPRYHIARPGDTTDAAHAAHQEAWIVEHFGSPERFWLQVALLYVRYAQESESPPEDS